MIALYSNLEKLYIKTTIKAIRRNVYYYFHKKTRLQMCIIFPNVYLHPRLEQFICIFIWPRKAAIETEQQSN